MKAILANENATHNAVESEWQRLARSSGYRATELASIAGVSLRTLQRHFRSCYGVTVSDWLKTVRLREADYRIRSGDRVKKVAFDLGYKQLSHFSREFKRAHGIPPTRIVPQVPSALKQAIAEEVPHLKVAAPFTY